jgi:hypothetical protein
MTTTLEICWAERKNYYASSAGGENWCQKITFAALGRILNKRIARCQAERMSSLRCALLFWLERARGWLMTCLTPLIMIIEPRKWSTR